jgi:hypothetical protein
MHSKIFPVASGVAAISRTGFAQLQFKDEVPLIVIFSTSHSEQAPL